MTKNNNSSSATLEKITSLCKRRGFVYQSADIYGGLNGVYDYGPLGTLMKNNIKNAWMNFIKLASPNIVFLDGAILGHHAIWEASGHVENFHDPMVDCLNCKHRYRADELNLEKACPHCGQKKWSEVRQFNMMFKTHVGATQEKGSIAYLRPESAQSIFVNFKNVMATTRIKIPFGIAQIGKAFRNEITPKQFLFRLREFEQMELEWFCKESQADEAFVFWVKKRHEFYLQIGINKKNIQLRSHDKNELAHYAKETTDIEYHFPFGWKELEGVANRTDFDLSQHSKHSGKDLSVFDEETKTSYIPYVIESSVGVDRLFLTLLFDAYHEEQTPDEQRVVLKLSPIIAPIKAAFFPLTKKQLEPMDKIYRDIQNKMPNLNLQFDVSGSIGKRYRRQDEIGTPVCFTYDFDSENDNSVTVRNRDSMKQERISIDSIASYINNVLQS